jgi:predicted secreted hydrolase
MMNKRAFLLWASATALAPRTWAGAPSYPPVQRGRPLAFPRDYGAHPDYRTEWWYVTGWLQADDGATFGFQVTFFRSRPELDDANPSRFAPAQLLFANVALSEARAGRIQHEQRSARSGFGLAEASVSDTDVHIGDWLMQRDAQGHYRVSIPTPRYTFALTMKPTQPMLLNGAAGYSSKGPLPAQASYYYSVPWLQVEGTLRRADGAERVRGTAWLDHEWSSALLADAAVGWDWIGINLDDGGALMAFQIRDRAGAKLWAGGTLRDADGRTRALSPDSVRFTPLRFWQSPRTGARYPVAMRVEAGDVRVDLAPLIDDQEVDSRASTGAVYWEGAASASNAGKTVGRGYLELTGYFRRLDL